MIRRSERVDPGRKVFAHYMVWAAFVTSLGELSVKLEVDTNPQVGLTCHQSPEQWAHDINTAKLAGIDGFSLNIGPSDTWTSTQLHHAYEEAERAQGFSLFLSFEYVEATPGPSIIVADVRPASMAAGSWLVPCVADLINRYKSSPAQTRVEGRPLVSTFEGPNWAANWPLVRDRTGGIYLIPDWSSLGPHGVGERLDLIDGACK